MIHRCGTFRLIVESHIVVPIHLWKVSSCHPPSRALPTGCTTSCQYGANRLYRWLHLSRQCANNFLDMVSRQHVAERSKQVQSQFADESVSLRIPWVPDDDKRA